MTNLKTIAREAADKALKGKYVRPDMVAEVVADAVTVAVLTWLQDCNPTPGSTTDDVINDLLASLDGGAPHLGLPGEVLES